MLRGVDLTLESGDGIRLCGVNGSGKSTLLRIVAGVSKPSSGRVERAARAVGWAPSDPIGGSSLPARAVFEAGERVYKVATTTRRDELIDRLGLGGHVDAPLRTRSVGTRRKVNLAFALLAPPGALLVLDEPWAALDANAGAQLTEVLTERRADGSCVLVSDHGFGPGSLGGLRPVMLENGVLRDAGGAGSVRVAARRGDEHQQLVVERDGSDALLARLLADGWSIDRVEPV